MPSMTVITPSFGPDFELCVDLNRSVLENAPASVQHQIIVPHRDLKQFSRLAGPRTTIRCEAEFLPRTFFHVPLTGFTLNAFRPFPPVRGWILQQVVKLGAAAACPDDVALLVDSDVEFVRPFKPETFIENGTVRLYRLPNGVHREMPRHLIWQREARSLLGLPPREPPHSDYVASLMAWDPQIVREMLARVAQKAGRAWSSAIAGELHFSEWTLYGVYVDEVLGSPANSFVSDDPLCHAHWGTDPLDLNSARAFFGDIRASDVAAMISAKSNTPLAVKRQAFADFRLTMSGGEHPASQTA